MRKKYLSALLFGALLFASAGTFTSCKDYDDDINNLQGQIDDSKASLTEKLTAVESSIASLEAAQAAMQTDIANAQAAADAAKLAATEAQANAIAEAQKQLEAAKAELTELIQKGDEAAQTEIDAANAEIAKVQGAVQALQVWQDTTEETLAKLADADAALATSLAGVQADLVDVANRVGKLETGLKTQEDALAAYKEENGADITAIEGQLATLNEAIQKLAGLEPDDLINMKSDITTLEGQVGELSNSIGAINENLNILYIAVYKGITHVALVDGYCVETGKFYSSNWLQLLSDIAVQTYTFGSDKYGDVAIRHMPTGSNLEDAVSFEKGTRMKQTAHALLRISPANATIAKSDIRLVDSKGNDLVAMGLVEVTNVNIFDGTLVDRWQAASRADIVSSGVTGLVEVEFQVGSKADEEGYDFDGEFMDAVTVKDAMGAEYAKSFAVKISQVKEIPATGEGATSDSFMRNVVSAYSLNLAPEKNSNASELSFNLYTDIKKQTEVANINNRWTSNGDENKGPVEYTWKSGAVKADLIYTGSNATAVKSYDNRTDNEAYSVKSGESFYVDLSRTPNAKYFYIVLDRDYVNKTNDQDSELAAWNSYESSIEGINKVYTVTDPKNAVAELSINIPYSDVIGFRVYAANADGSLVDPDGKAFYVQVGEPAATISVPTQDITATRDRRDLGMKSAFISVADLEGWSELVAAAEASNVTTYSIITDTKMKEAIRGDKGDIDPETLINENVFSVEYYKDNVEGSETVTPTTLTNLKAVKYIKLVFDQAASDLVDEHTYTGKVTFKVTTGTGDAGTTSTIGIMNLSAKKVMPEVPTGYSAKTNQIVDGKYLCYVLPYMINGTYPKNDMMDGYMNLTNSFNLMTDFMGWVDGEAVYSQNSDPFYTFTFKNAAYDKDGKQIDNVVDYAHGLSNYKLSVDYSLVDDANPYKTIVEYNFGEISYAYDEVTNKFVKGYWVKEIDSFDTEFRCPASAQTWKWLDKSAALNNKDKNGAELNYGVPVGPESPFLLKYMKGINSYDNTKYGLTLDGFYETDIIGGTWNSGIYDDVFKIEMITNGNRINEYFTPSLEKGKDAAGNTSACVAFEPTDEAAPQQDVEATLRLTFKDKFGHPVVINLPMNIRIDKGE